MQMRHSKMTLIVDRPLGRSARYGVSVLRKALQERHVSFDEAHDVSHGAGDTLLLIGTRDSETIQNVLFDLPEGKETLRIARIACDGRPSLAVCGGDDRGLMYALLDVAERIGWATEGDPLACVLV